MSDGSGSSLPSCILFCGGWDKESSPSDSLSSEMERFLSGVGEVSGVVKLAGGELAVAFGAGGKKFLMV